jgi:hypothetical protein
MLRSKEEILAEIDSTLNQLIINIEIVSDVLPSDLSETEIHAMHKTQESLLARFMHMNDLIKDEERKKLQEKQTSAIEAKLKKFGELNASFIESITTELSSSLKHEKRPRIGKNRKGLKIS